MARNVRTTAIHESLSFRIGLYMSAQENFLKKMFRVLSTYNFACRLVVVDVVVSRSMISLPLPPFSKL